MKLIGVGFLNFNNLINILITIGQISDILSFKNRIKAFEVENKDILGRLEYSERINKQLVLELENQLKINQGLSIIKEEYIIY